MTQTEHPHQIALARFLAAHPQLQDELDHLNPLAAQAAGVTAQAYRDERLHEAFEEEAQRLGFFAWELTLQLTAESPEAFDAQRREVHKEVAEMAGMQWAQYCELHGLEP
ncbi:DUF6388 family protein [Pseudomonas sp. DWP3-1-2]|jgi:DNA-binding LytR/AlgR family response regulator|uniref:DUF6388 family protein n=1 Tax=Pseudomonas sp. DWP3-1-2 TaxID=2804645 RepID=UPI003CE989BE